MFPPRTSFERRRMRDVGSEDFVGEEREDLAERGRSTVGIRRTRSPSQSVSGPYPTQACERNRAVGWEGMRFWSGERREVGVGDGIR